MRAILTAWLSLTVLVACEPESPCDSTQFFGFGACVQCPDDAVPMKMGCQCDDPDKVFDTGMRACVLPPGTVVDAGTGDAGGAEAGDTAALCGEFCMLGKECVADNELVGGFLVAELEALGINGSSISGCLSDCTEGTSDDTDSAVLECLAAARQSATCAGDDGIEGGQQALSIFSGCCTPSPEAHTCMRLCNELGASAIGSMLSFCP